MLPVAFALITRFMFRVQCRFTSTAETISSVSLFSSLSFFFYVHRRDHLFKCRFTSTAEDHQFSVALRPLQRPSVQCRFMSTAETICSVSLYVHRRDHLFSVALCPPQRPSVQCRFFLRPLQRPSVHCRFFFFYVHRKDHQFIVAFFFYVHCRDPSVQCRFFFLHSPQRPSVQCRFTSTAETIGTIRDRALSVDHLDIFTQF